MKLTKPLEVVYIYSFLTSTQEGDVVMYVAFDKYSQYAFEPYSCLMHKTDDDIKTAIETIVRNVFKEYNSLRHSRRTIIVTNLPQETNSIVENSHKNIYKVVSDVEKTEKFVIPILDKMFS